MLATSSREYHENATRKLLTWNFSFTERTTCLLFYTRKYYTRRRVAEHSNHARDGTNRYSEQWDSQSRLFANFSVRAVNRSSNSSVMQLSAAATERRASQRSAVDPTSSSSSSRWLPGNDIKFHRGGGGGGSSCCICSCCCCN